VYRKISGSDTVKAALLKKGEELEKRVQDQPATNTPSGDTTNQKLKADVAEFRKQQAEYLATYKEFGFEPLTRQQLSDYFSAQGTWANTTGRERFFYGLEAASGWTIMTLLLSVGAPFWLDALESLFGIKNLLRKRSDTQNVEGQKGGQPKP